MMQYNPQITIYRYFENKHKLLLYLLSWYWEWVKYSIAFNIQNIADPQKKLAITIRTLIQSNQRNALVEYIDEEKLHALVQEESEKAYHTKHVDEENKEGFFRTLKSLKSEITQIILEINPAYPFPNSLASTLLEMSSSLHFYARHLPSMADAKDQLTNHETILKYLLSLTKSALLQQQ